MWTAVIRTLLAPRVAFNLLETSCYKSASADSAATHVSQLIDNMPAMNLPLPFGPEWDGPYAFNECLSFDYTGQPYGYAFSEHQSVDYIPPISSFAMESSSDAGYTSNKYPSLHYGELPHDHINLSVTH